MKISLVSFAHKQFLVFVFLSLFCLIVVQQQSFGQNFNRSISTAGPHHVIAENSVNLKSNSWRLLIVDNNVCIEIANLPAGMSLSLADLEKTYCQNTRYPMHSVGRSTVLKIAVGQTTDSKLFEKILNGEGKVCPR